MANAKARRPHDLILLAGRAPAMMAVLLLATGAGGQTKSSGSGTSPSSVPPWQVKADPKAVKTSAPAKPAAQPTPPPPPPRDPTRPAPSGGSAQNPEDKARVKVSEHMTVDLHVKDESINNVLELLSVQSQKNIIASKNVSGKVSADLFNVTFYEALDAILHVNGFQYIEKGNFIYVYTREEFLEIQKALSKRVAKVIRLSYLNATDAETFVKPLLSQGGETKVTAKTPEFTVGADTPVGKDDYALGAILVVIDYEENISAIEKLLVELDTRPAQVLVEATILETRVTENNGFGIDFSIIGDLDFIDFVSVGGPRAAADALIRGGTGAVGGLSPQDNRGGAISTSPGSTQTGRGNVKVGVVAGPVAMFLRALDEVSDFTVLSSPKLLALNRMPTRVLVGQRVGYLNTTSTETSTTQTVQFLDTGTQLYFRPFVSNTGEVRMELKPKVASATIRDAGNGQGGIVSIPDETTQEVTTNVIVKDGNTIVLGGLFVERTDSFRRQVPIFGDIPLIGAAFRGHDDSTDRRELIFLIRPSIVNDTALAMQGVDMKNEIERIRAGQRQGLLPWSREKMTSVLNVEAESAARAGQTEEALWKIQRSLSLNPRQPDAIRLRERITSEQERWPAMFTLDGIISGEIHQRLEGVKPVPGAQKMIPDRSVDIPTRPTSSGGRSDAGGIEDGSRAANGGAPGFENIGGSATDEQADGQIGEQPSQTTAQNQPGDGRIELPGGPSAFPFVSEPRSLAEGGVSFDGGAGAESPSPLPAGELSQDRAGPGTPAPAEVQMEQEAQQEQTAAAPEGLANASPAPQAGNLVEPKTESNRMGFWQFVQVIFFSRSFNTGSPQQPTLVDVPADAAHQGQELSK